MLWATRLRCSFCRRDADQVVKLVAGPGVYICDRCVAAASRIMDEADGAPPPLDVRPGIVTKLLRRLRRACRPSQGCRAIAPATRV